MWCLCDPRAEPGWAPGGGGCWKRSAPVQLTLVYPQQVMLALVSLCQQSLGLGMEPGRVGSCPGAGCAQAPALALCPHGRAQGTKAALSACPLLRGSLKVTAEFAWRISFIRW